ncbi:collagen alpha-2(I) chain-like [Manacus candei]|uniref:collagen alpha-2(I) chain-like n=1 Tax=Manacus candei TaxID=415023 RepID=UPI00222731B6|nr:collagen alpha-2(I) chain-like [Manacus candei]
MGPPRYTGAHMPRTRRRAAAVSPARRQRRTHALRGAEGPPGAGRAGRSAGAVAARVQRRATGRWRRDPPSGRPAPAGTRVCPADGGGATGPGGDAERGAGGCTSERRLRTVAAGLRAGELEQSSGLRDAGAPSAATPRPLPRQRCPLGLAANAFERAGTRLTQPHLPAASFEFSVYLQGTSPCFGLILRVEQGTQPVSILPFPDEAGGRSTGLTNSGRTRGGAAAPNALQQISAGLRDEPPGPRSSPVGPAPVHTHAGSRRCGERSGTPAVCGTERSVTRGGAGVLARGQGGAGRFPPGLCTSLPCGAPTFPARQPNGEASVHGKTLTAGALRERRGTGPLARQTAAEVRHHHRGRRAPLWRTRCRLPAELPILPRTGRSPDRVCSPQLRRSLRRRHPPPGASLSPGPCPRPPSYGAVPLPGPARSVAPAERFRPRRSRRRPRMEATDPTDSPRLGRMDVNELRSVVTNNNNNKLSGCCSVAQTNAS